MILLLVGWLIVSTGIQSSVLPTPPDTTLTSRSAMATDPAVINPAVKKRWFWTRKTAVEGIQPTCIKAEFN